MPGARWVEPSKFRLTLRFIGAVQEPMAADITAALLRVAAPRFALTLTGVGNFGGRTLWVGVDKNPTLMFLQSRIEGELQQIGLPADPARMFRTSSWCICADAGALVRS